MAAEVISPNIFALQQLLREAGQTPGAELLSIGKSGLLVSSPYTEPDHLLNLDDLESTDRLLAQALAILQPSRPDYATAPYEETFNWSDVISRLRELSEEEGQQWNEESHYYIVEFRSQRSASANLIRMAQLDKESHREATESGGLLKYWFGAVDAERRNLATCLWRNQADARAGGSGPWHKQARLAARALYDNVNITSRRLTLSEGLKEWRIDLW